MKVLLIGSGAREHAIAWKLSQSPNLTQLYISPGNAGTKGLGIQKNLSDDFTSIHKFIQDQEIDLMVVGPEIPLVDGIVDYMKIHQPDLKIIGPDQAGARLEGSKDFSKQFMLAEGIPTADYSTIHKNELEKGYDVLTEMSPPYVLKADGLAAGKGVIITSDLEEAKNVLKEMLEGQFGTSSSKVVIESFLTGIEFSAFALVDGQNYVLLPIAKDYKRIGEGDTGPNTGGMGAVSPVDFVDDEMKSKLTQRIIKPTIEGLKKRGIHYCGFIFFGIINCGGDPYVIEYNCRLGDPETQVVLPRLKNDLLELFIAATNGALNDINISIYPEYYVNVVLASGGYPGEYEKNKIININDPNQLIFHAGTKFNDNQLTTNGGRVISCCGSDESLSKAINNAYLIADNVNFENKIYRSDIGQDLLK